MVDPNNLSLRRELNWELENFIFPRFSWLSPDEIVKQVAVETMASLHQVEKQWEADEKKK